jgi:hypothetical protein
VEEEEENNDSIVIPSHGDFNISLDPESLEVSGTATPLAKANSEPTDIVSEVPQLVAVVQ